MDCRGESSEEGGWVRSRLAFSRSEEEEVRKGAEGTRELEAGGDRFGFWLPLSVRFVGVGRLDDIGRRGGEVEVRRGKGEREAAGGKEGGGKRRRGGDGERRRKIRYETWLLLCFNFGYAATGPERVKRGVAEWRNDRGRERES